MLKHSNEETLLGVYIYIKKTHYRHGSKDINYYRYLLQNNERR